MKFIFSFLQTETPYASTSGIYHYDPLTLFDGSNDQSTQIDKLSGNLGSFGISSSGNFLFLKFESNDINVYTVFLATIHYGNTYLNIK